MKKLLFLIVVLFISCATDEIEPTIFNVKIGNTALPVAYEGQEYYHKFSIKGDERSYEWYCNPLPNGLFLENGVISGVPVVGLAGSSPYGIGIWAENDEDPNWLVVGNIYIILIISGESPPPPVAPVATVSTPTGVQSNNVTILYKMMIVIYATL